MKKVIKIASIVLFVGVIMLIISFILNGTPLLSTQKIVHIDQTMELEVDEAKNLLVKSDLANVEIYESETNEVKIHLHGEFFEKESIMLQKEIRGKEIIIATKGRDVGHGITLPDYISSEEKENNSGRYIDIYIPKNAFEQVKVELLLGEIKIKDHSFKNLGLKTNVGTIYVRNVEGNIVSESSVGDIIFETSETFGGANFSIESSVGDVSFEGNVIETFGTENRKFADKIGEGKYNVTLKTDVGSIHVND